jgi:SP family sugar:H+ symporter-like MFS transporter
MVWETKGLTLEQVDRMMEETGAPRKSAGWNPHSTFAAEMGIGQGGKMPVQNIEKQTGAAHHDGQTLA